LAGASDTTQSTLGGRFKREAGAPLDKLTLLEMRPRQCFKSGGLGRVCTT
jgi:hypothetical protein